VSDEVNDCAFCAIVAGTASATFEYTWTDAIAIRPRSGGVNDSHLLVIPRVHVADAGEDPEVTAAVMRRAAEVMAERPSANLITSKGKPATQSVFHLHVHVITRTAGDGLPLPWTPQHEVERAAKAAATDHSEGK
jgi:histidine triad (HIT) family protein